MEKSFGLESMSREEVKEVGVDLDTAQFAEKPLREDEKITLPDGTTVGREAHVRTRIAEIAARLKNEDRTWWEKLSGQNKITGMDLLHAEALIEDTERTAKNEKAKAEQEFARTRAIFEEGRGLRERDTDEPLENGADEERKVA